MYSRSNINSLTSPSPTLKRQANPPTGLAGFGPFLAEDNMIGLSLWHELGLKHAMTGDVAMDFLGALSVKDYIDRRVRWIRVRKKMTPIVATAIEPFTESIMCGIYGSWAIARLIGATRLSLFIVHMALWFLVDLNVKKALESRAIGVPKPARLDFLLAWLAREILALPIFLFGVLRSDVVWRGKKYRIMGSGMSPTEMALTIRRGDANGNCYLEGYAQSYEVSHSCCGNKEAVCCRTRPRRARQERQWCLLTRLNSTRWAIRGCQ